MLRCSSYGIKKFMRERIFKCYCNLTKQKMGQKLNVKDRLSVKGCKWEW